MGSTAVWVLCGKLGVGVFALGVVVRVLKIARGVRIRQYQKDPRRTKWTEDDKRVAKLDPLLAVREIVRKAQADGGAAENFVIEFQSRAKTCTEITNCVTEFLTEAGDAAKKLSAASASDRKALPLCGVPVSVKECYAVAGTASTHGLQRYKGVNLSEDATLVKMLKAAGAFPFCKTNVPQIMFSWECSNPVYGTTSHPLHRHFIPGGSSGGESCLINQRGSVIGIGTDIGGSCRIPAHMAGCVGIKATKNRLSVKGKARPTLYGDGQENIASCAGILGSTVDDVAAFFEGVLSPKVIEVGIADDPYMLPMAWDNAKVSNKAPLRFGFYEDDGYIEASPACRRAVRETVAALRAAGHEVVEFTLPNGQLAFETFVALISCSSALIAEELRGDTVADSLVVGMQAAALPPAVKRLAAAAKSSSSQLFSRLIPIIGEKQTSAVYQHVANSQKVKTALAAAMRAADVDVLLSPAFALPTHPHCAGKDFLPAVSYTSIYNVVDYPAGIVPWTTLQPTDVWDKGAGRDQAVEAKMMESYNLALGTGCPFPIGVQLAAKPYQEEVLVKAMRIVEECSNRQLWAAPRAK